MTKIKLAPILMLLALALPALAAFSIAATGQTGKDTLRTQTCNVQTTLDFRFSSTSVGTTASSLGSSYLSFLDRYGNDLNLPLTNFGITTSMNSYVSGYSMTGTISHAVLFLFSDGTNKVYMYVPFSTDANAKSADAVDLTSTSAPTNSLSSYSSGSSLSAFNFFDNTDYNQWYTSVVGTSTILISKFIYKVSTALNASDSGNLGTTITGLKFEDTVGSTGNKLCYASLTTGNFQTHMRESVALWFIEVGILIYWLIYLFSDSTNRTIYNKEMHRDNAWTTWSLYSVTHLAHEEFFTRLLRLTVIMIQWTIQGVFIASIIAAQYTTGAAIIIWSAVIAWAATLIFPFLWGSVFHSKIYEKHLKKLELKKKIFSAMDKQKTKPFEQEIDMIEENLYGYYHWFYSIVFVIFFICWPITINRLQQLPRQYYYYQWYWLAAMGIVFVLEYFIMQPLMLLLFHNRELFKKRGGYYYDHRLGQLYQQVNDI